jgi:hypothetical protein
MSVPTSEVGYTSAIAGRGEHEVHLARRVPTVGALRTTLSAPCATVGALRTTLSAPCATVGALHTTLCAPYATVGALRTTLSAPCVNSRCATYHIALYVPNDSSFHRSQFDFAIPNDKYTKGDRIARFARTHTKAKPTGTFGNHRQYPFKPPHNALFSQPKP